MNKYYKALERVGIYGACGSLNTPDGQLIEYGDTEFCKDLETLNNLINKMEKIGLELNNTHFMDNDCKLKTLEIIERIFRE